MEEVLWEGVTRLGKQTASSGLELSAKFASDADYALQVIIPPLPFSKELLQKGSFFYSLQ